MGGGSSGGSSGGTQQVVSSQQIPQYEQQFSQANQNLAQSLAAQPYPVYQGQLVAGMTPQQLAGMQMAGAGATAYQPDLSAGERYTQHALDPTAFNNYQNAAGGVIGGGLNDQNFVALLRAASGATGAGLNDQNFVSYANAAGQAAGQGMNGALSNSMIGGAAQTGANAVNDTAATPGVVHSYMNPYVQAALMPQLENMQTELGLQQQQNASSATEGNAFGDARQGVAQGLTNYYGDQTLANIVGTGYNNAYNTAVQAAQNQQNIGLQGATLFNNLANTAQNQQALQLQGGNLLSQLAGQAQGEQGIQLQGAGLYGQQAGLANQEQNTQLQGASQLAQLAAQTQAEQNIQLAGGQQMANLGQLQQQLGITGANALYNAGAQQQQLQQQELAAAYAQYQNQVNWPYQMLNVRESALSNSPYNIAQATVVPGGNQTAQGLGSFAQLAGMLGSLNGGGSNIFGGSTFNSAQG